MSARTLLPFALLASLAGLSCFGQSAQDPRLRGGTRSPVKNGWIPVRLQGSPAQIGYQHGYLLATEIRDALEVTRLSLLHDGAAKNRDWAFYRTAAQKVFWPRVDEEYKQELQAMAEGMAARGVPGDVTDLVILNANLEMGYYTDTLDGASGSKKPERCSAFVATGSYTRDGRVVIGHNNWSGYLEGARWNIIFDLRPEKGHRILMDGFPGMIHSGDDFGVNDAGIVITETTISQFHGFDTSGIPEFSRARKAMQYSESIDDFARIMRDGNNGGYANTWLVADLNRNEIARLELGLKYVTLERNKDGQFVGANYPIDPRLIAEETTFPAKDMSVSSNARKTRWEQLMKKYKGKIDLTAGKSFLADHYDAYASKADAPSERTLCGHIDLSPRGLPPWWPEPYGPAGTVQAKITDSSLGLQMKMEASNGHPCGIDFRAAPFLAQHPGYNWQKPKLRDLPSEAWAQFSAPAK